MSTLAVESDPRAMDVIVTDDELTVHLVDGRRVSAPLVWYHACCTLLRTSEMIGEGEGIHWPQNRRGFEHRRNPSRHASAAIEARRLTDLTLSCAAGLACRSRSGAQVAAIK
jgi:hypothetical protein